MTDLVSYAQLPLLHRLTSRPTGCNYCTGGERGGYKLVRDEVREIHSNGRSITRGASGCQFCAQVTSAVLTLTAYHTTYLVLYCDDLCVTRPLDLVWSFHRSLGIMTPVLSSFRVERPRSRRPSSLSYILQQHICECSPGDQ
ncbi:hypothetical protein BHE74_00001225 [Ensete ventricosum]|nr:hypothetical protein GW17_00053745 [Ensete ventricosum]RWW89730.1 hypothetical protein BHE74_00001225 [Ensete ventricosum]